MHMPSVDNSLAGALESGDLRAIFEAQSTLLEKLVAAARPPYEREMVRMILTETIAVSNKLTGAEHGRLILFDSDGKVSDSLLPEWTEPQAGIAFIAQVLAEGLEGWVAHHHEVGLVTDAGRDPRWRNPPSQPYAVGSALCLPIVSAEMLLGILTLVHATPGFFTPKITEIMRIMAGQMALILENAKLFGNLSESLNALGATQQHCALISRSLTEEINKCRKMQMDFLPGELPRFTGWEIEGFFFPANRVSGDFYDVFELPGGYLGFVIGDVCDKGVGAALFMALFRSLIRIFSGEAQLDRSPIDRARHSVGGRVEDPPSRRFDQIDAIRAVALVNDYIAREHGEMSMFATLFMGVLDPANGRLIYINGGHEPVFLLNADGSKKDLKPTGPAVGVFLHADFIYNELTIAPGDMLFGCTDGVVDARSSDGARLTKDRLTALLDKPASSAAEMMGRVGTELFAHMGMAPQEDDVTMLALRRETL